MESARYKMEKDETYETMLNHCLAFQAELLSSFGKGEYMMKGDRLEKQCNN